MVDEETSIELAKNRAWPLLERLEARLDAGEISEAQWYDEVAAVIVPATKKPINYHALDIMQVKDGKLVHGWTYANGFEFATQLGLAPKPGAEKGAKAGDKAAPAKPADKAGPAKPADKAAPAKPADKAAPAAPPAKK